MAAHIGEAALRAHAVGVVWRRRSLTEPADAALAGHDPTNRMTGIADQRIESWFTPFGGTIATGCITGDG